LTILRDRGYAGRNTTKEDVMRTHFRLAVIVVAALTLGPSPARAIHDADVTDAEFQCQFKTEIIAWRNFAKRISCVVSCERDARAGGDIADCSPPFAGSTQGCVNGVNGKAQSGICKACNADVPECYPAAANCPDLSDAELAPTQANADAVLSDIYCDDSGSGDGLTDAEAKCEAGTAKVLAKFGVKKATCLAKCHRLEHRGITPPGSCPNDVLGKTQACIMKVTDASVLKIDKACSPSFGSEAPECQAGKTGAQWVQEIEDEVDDLDPDYICGSPSGAFLE